ncbi:MAG: di-heme oxidoredictase family protein [Pseudomonadota bacterium]|nr:di-heme oxidoredictase family protein [Pseudomonadota bacterium]
MLLLLACTDPAIEASGPPAPVVAPVDGPADAPIEGLSDAWSERYDDGYDAFDTIFRTGSGLGPTYINMACVACHAGAERGPGVVTKMVVMDGDAPAADQSALPWGPTERPRVAGGGETPISVPTDVANLLVTERVGPAVYGRGYLEAVADDEIERVEAEQAAAGIVSGRINRLAWSGVEADSAFHDWIAGDTGLIGRFGVKARIVTLDEFAADALQGDMAITSPMRPTELPNPDGLDDDSHDGVDTTLEVVNRMADFTRLLAIPPRPVGIEAGEGDAAVGHARFAEVGCAECHVPSLRTRADYPVEPLADIDAWVYTDLLLHDLGTAMADGQADGTALSGEWRTAPLIGLSHHATFLHDGRADSIVEAIAAHGGEADAAREAFEQLPSDEQAALAGFVLAL